MRGQKGITLVALIITIVVLLILAVVAISAINSDNIFQHANNAATKWNTAVDVEGNEVNKAQNYLDKWDPATAS